MEKADVEDRIRQALLACDQRQFERTMIVAMLVTDADEVERIAREALADAPHDVHAFWNGPCSECPSPN